MAFCRNCGKEIDAAARYCPHCGAGQIGSVGAQGAPAEPGYANATRKDPGVAVLLSFLWSGAGQVYAGAIRRGIWQIVIGGFLLLWMLGSAGAAFIFAFPFWIWSMFDARTQAIKQNGQHFVPTDARP